jgi:lipoprotein-releasing system permease protein
LISKKLLGINENVCSYIDITIINNNDLEAIYTKVSKLLKNDIKVLNWKELNKDLYDVMQLERVAVFCVLSLILLIAVFNVFASLAMTVMEKKQDIAILKSIGASNNFISQIYLLEGLLIGFIGTFLGLIIGVLLTFGQDTYKWIKISGTGYIIDAIPVNMINYEVAIICIFSIFLSFIATILPAKKSNQLIISQAIRGE